VTKRFIVAVDSSTKEQNDAFREYVKAIAPQRWWHWLEDLWLLVDVTGKINAAQLRDKATEVYLTENIMVFELSSTGHDTWAGYGPQTTDRNMFNWIEKYWSE
jgi:hypothetical protein